MDDENLVETYNDLNKKIKEFNTNDPEEEAEPDIENRYCELLDGINGEVKFSSLSNGGMTYSASRILKEVDPVTFRVEVNDFASGLLAEAQNAIDNEQFDNPEIENLFPTLYNYLEDRALLIDELESNGIVFDGYEIDHYSDNDNVANFKRPKPS